MVYILVLKTKAGRIEGSNPSTRTNAHVLELGIIIGHSGSKNKKHAHVSQLAEENVLEALQ
jgi:hypothetical protein